MKLMNSGFFLVMDCEVSTSEWMDVDQPIYDNRTWTWRPRKPNHTSLWQLAQNCQDLVSGCQFPYFFLPLLPNQDQSKKATYVLQTNNILCPASRYPTSSFPGAHNLRSELTWSISFCFHCKASPFLCLPLSLCQTQKMMTDSLDIAN